MASFWGLFADFLGFHRRTVIEFTILCLDVMATFVDISVIVPLFVLALLFGSFLEYWIHRMFHVRPSHPVKKLFPKLGRGHTSHHVNGSGQGFLWEFRNYVLGTSPVLIPPFFISFKVGIIWSLGIVSYAAFAAFAHQLQHDIPPIQV
jgi:hypothetical protein